MAQEDITALEPCWRELDVQWLALNLSTAEIQGIHDLNYGYGDPLRTKVGAGSTHVGGGGRLGSLRSGVAPPL